MPFNFIIKYKPRKSTLQISYLKDLIIKAKY